MGQVEVQDVSVGVETLTRQCVCFVWTFRDQINLNVVYTMRRTMAKRRWLGSWQRSRASCSRSWA